MVLSKAQRVKIKRGKKSPVPSIIIGLFVITLLSGAVAALWHNVTLEDSSLVSEPYIDPALLDGPITVTSSSQVQDLGEQQYESDEAGSEKGSAEGSGKESQPDDISSLASQSLPTIEGAVPQSDRVASTYFDDAVFVGDSLTTGIKLYEVMQNTTVYAATGISLENIFTKQVVQYDSEEITILDALSRQKPAKIYVMLGANSLGGTIGWAVSEYGVLIDEIKKVCPDSIIYIQSVLPLYEPYFKNNYNADVTNEKIDSFNSELCKMAQEKGVYYLDLASAFKDETGAMPEEYTPDGMHINSAQYTMWFDYLKTHTVQ